MIYTFLKILCFITASNLLVTDIAAVAPRTASDKFITFVKEHSSLCVALSLLGCAIGYKLFTQEAAQEGAEQLKEQKFARERKQRQREQEERRERERSEERKRREQFRQNRQREQDRRRDFWQSFNQENDPNEKLRKLQEELRRAEEEFRRAKEEAARQEREQEEFMRNSFRNGFYGSAHPHPVPALPAHLNDDSALQQLYQDTGTDFNQTPAQVLGVSANASRAQINDAFKHLSKESHPDKHKQAGETEAQIKDAENHFKLYSACRSKCLAAATH